MGKITFHKNIDWLFTSIVSMHVLLLSKITFFPYPELFVYPYLTNIGLKPYAQILDQHFPGLMFFPLNLGNMGMTTVMSARLVHFFLVVLTHILLYKILKKITNSRNYSLLGGLLYLVIQSYFEGYTLWIDTFIPPFLLSAVYLYLNKKATSLNKNIFFVGLILGLAMLTKQIVGPIALLFGVYLAYERRDIKYLMYFGIGFAVPGVLMVLYQFLVGTLEDFIYWTVTFNVTVFKESGRKFATINELVKASLFLLPGILSALFLIKRRKTREVGLLIGTFLLGSFLFAYARFDLVHLQPVIPFAIIALVCSSYFYKNVVTRGFLLLFVVFSLFVGARFFSRHWGGEVYFFSNNDQAVFDEVRARVLEKDPVFAFGTYPHIYSETNTRPSGNLFVFQFPWFMSVAEGRILDGLKYDPPKVVLRDTMAITDGMNLIDNMPQIKEYIERYYVVDKTIGDTDIMIPR